MRIDVWSDIVCPFCHLGRRQLAIALERFGHADELETIWHSFELDRSAPSVGDGSNLERVAAKYGVPVEQMRVQHAQMAAAAAEVGLDFAWDRIVPSNSYDAHRLLHAARAHGVEESVTDRIMRGWNSEGAAIGDPSVLRGLALEGGLAPSVVEEVLGSDDFGIEVRTDEALAGQIGITAVPTFVLDQKYAVAGAQPVDVMVRALEAAWADRGNRPAPAPADACGGGGCGCGSGGCSGSGAGAGA